MRRISRAARGSLFCLVLIAAAWGLFAVIGTQGRVTAEEAISKPNPHARPAALVYLKQAQRVLVANRDSGTLVTIDPVSLTVVGTWRIPGAEQLADLIASEDGQFALTCSVTQNRVWLLRRLHDREFQVLATLDVPTGPIGLSWLPKDRDANVGVSIACQWAREVVLASVNPDGTPATRLIITKSVPLSHAPHRMLPIPDGARLLITDAFGGSISVINTITGTLERTRNLPGHNVHGLGYLPATKRVIVAQQILNPVAETSRDSVFWGIVMTNNLRLIPVENFLQDKRPPLDDADIHFLGQPNHGAGDPTCLALAESDTILTTLGGVDELAVGVQLDHSYDRIKVGRHPVAVVTDPTGQFAYVANQFSDSVSAIDIKKRKVLAEIPLLDQSQTRENTLAEQGEILFHDARLSLDGWYSCHSCHTSGHTAGLLNDNLGDGNFGAPKRIPSLLGVADTAPFLWSGNRTDLAEQTRKSITTTMHGRDPSDEQIKALVAYMQTLAPPPRIVPSDATQVTRGAKLFESHGCNDCHAAPTFTSADIYDVGLKDQHGRTEFNPPSLRGLRYRGPYLHDLRAATLREVFTSHQHPRPTKWSSDELDDLEAFLLSL